MLLRRCRWEDPCGALMAAGTRSSYSKARERVLSKLLLGLTAPTVSRRSKSRSFWVPTGETISPLPGLEQGGGWE